jgi:hypothetical protein
MALDLNNCDKVCTQCIKRYKCKHSLVAGQLFKVKCKGIPLYNQLEMFTGMAPEQQEAAVGILDPVRWAAETLDWHCLDPDGSIWARKNPEEYAEWIADHPGESILGQSRYHRPYQAEMLRCSARRKVFRIGRQAGKTEAIVVSMLYHLFTKPGLPPEEGFKIVVLTPYQAQIDLIFKRMMELLRVSPTTNNSISRHVKAPIYTITLHNGSEVKGFTAGTKSGGNADAIRGQHANMLVFDEADYLAPKDMESALSIIINYPNASVWMSSTPSGKREKFFETCNSTGWREFYYTSKVNPMFNDHLDAMFREQMSQIAYKHEVLADFGEQEEGVFQNVYVQAAKFDYKYGDIPRNANWVYTMGVDWNDTRIGTTIVVLGFDPGHNKFFVVDRHTVSRDGWTQLSACQKIAELNRLWRPLVIYIDAGFGGTQWEVLRKYGYDSSVDPSKGPMHPDARLKDIVKRYDFGSKVEVHDLWTHAPLQKPAKPFLVESTVRRFETQDIKFSKYDELLEKQLLGYVIDRVTPTGVPVYKASDENTGDHTLDALLLSVIGFVLEATPLGKPRYATNISFTGYFGERIMPEIHQGDTVINVPKKEGEERKRLRPEMSRTAPLQPTTLLGVQKEMPGAHIQSPKQLGLWDWPGRLEDAPRPRVRSLSEAESDARKRTGFMMPRLASRPRRKNI